MFWGPVFRLAVAAGAALLALMPPTLQARQASGPPARRALAIVVNHRNPVTDLTLAELRRIFMLETQHWPHARRITVVLRAEGQPERAEALRLICGLDARDYRRHVQQEYFRGKAMIGSPRDVRSAASVKRFVFNAPGAIGAIGADEVDAQVKVVRVDGHLPDDPLYPLRLRGER